MRVAFYKIIIYSGKLNEKTVVGTDFDRDLLKRALRLCRDVRRRSAGALPTVDADDLLLNFRPGAEIIRGDVFCLFFDKKRSTMA